MIFKENPKEKRLQQELFDQLKLSVKNREIAEKYLDMEHPEDPALLAGVERQDSGWRRSGDYVERLQKKKRTQELGRYLRYLVQVSGAQAWNYFVYNVYGTDSKELEQTLSLLDGVDAGAQRLAVWGGLCTAALLNLRPGEGKLLCQWGAEHRELFQDAMKWCYDYGKQFIYERGKQIRAFLAAAWLYHEVPGTAEDAVRYLEEVLPCAVEAALPLSDQERRDILSYLRNADRDTPFPGRFVAVLKGKRNRINRSMTALTAACAFLALRHSVRFEILLRMMAAVDIGYGGRENTALKICKGIMPEDCFDERMAEIEGMLPVPDADYMIWCIREKYDRGAERMAACCPEAVRKAGSEMESEEYRELIEKIRDANPALYQELQASFREVYCEKSARELSANVYPGQDEAAQYLLGTCRADALETFIPEWSLCDYRNEWTFRKIERLKEVKESAMYRRALILEMLRKETGYFREYRLSGAGEDGSAVQENPDVRQEAGGRTQKIDYISQRNDSRAAGASLLTDRQQIGAILDLMEKEAVPVRLMAEGLGGMWSVLKEKQEKTAFMELCSELLAEKLQYGTPGMLNGLAEAAAHGSAAACCLCLYVFARSGEQYREQILSCAGNGAKQVQAVLTEICGAHKEWAPAVLDLLGSKKVREREFAVLTVEKWGDVSHLDRIRAALETEKNKKLIALMTEAAEELEKEAAMEAEMAADPGRAQRREWERTVAGILRGALKRKVEWIRELRLPAVHFEDGAEAPAEYLPAIPALYAEMDTPGRNETAAELASVLEPKEFHGYICALYEGWLEAGGEAKKRWVLYVFSLHGGAESVPALYKQIRDWTEHSRGAMAAEAVQALVLNGSQEALLYVDQMSRKFKNRQVKHAAAAALAGAAEKLHISREELEDGLVPDLGFNERMERVFDYGSRSFTVRLNTALEAEVYDGSGKRLKNMPAPGRQDDPDQAVEAVSEFKQMKRQLKTVTAGQKLRLEQALAAARLWQAEKWQKLFVKNPIMHLFATELIWGIYEDGRLKETFRYMEDGSFNTVDEEEYMLPQEAMVGLVHPLELTEAERSTWKEQLSDYDVTQPFAQLERPVYQITEEEKTEKAFARFYGTEINGRSLSARLLAAGWIRGEILDAGFYTKFYRNDGDVGAELTFSGCSVGYEDEAVTVKELYFYRIPGQDMEDRVHTMWEKARCLLSEVNPRYFSEVVLQAAKAAGVFYVQEESGI